MNRQPWVEHKFHFEIHPGWVFNIISRLEDASLRLRHYAFKISEDQASQQIAEHWSIKQHIGHLGDLETLHTGRLHDFEEGKDTLRAADMTNQATEEANHNAMALEDLLQQFEFKRKVFVQTLLELNDEAQERVALHPRLKEYMRPVDVAYFTAEHDDHHIESIRQIVKLFN